MSQETITNNVFAFLKKLEKNNTREWFTEHKSEFKEIELSVKKFYTSVMENMNVHDEIEKMKLFRIYRDVRFSKDKTPYKSHFAGSFTRAGAANRGGYYMRIKPGETAIAVGFFDPNKEDLLRIRKELELDASEFIEVTTKPNFKKIWGTIEGDDLKTAPKGFDKEHKNIELLRRKQFIFSRSFTDKEVLAPNFIEEVNTSFKAIRPYFNLMSDILTTNLNGESLLD